jgi:hypothetical protein
MPPNGKRSHFVKYQEAARKDVERCFGVLQARFAIVRNPASQWSMDFITDIMFSCCTLHNMILANEEGVHGLEDIIGDLQEDAIHVGRGLSFPDFLTYMGEI